MLMLTVRSAETDKVKALDVGANDFVSMPFGMDCVRNLVRQRLVAEASALTMFDDGHPHIGLVRREVLLDGRPVVLTRKEFALLSLLVANAGRVQPIRQRGDDSHAENVHCLRVMVGKLRQKLGG